MGASPRRSWLYRRRLSAVTLAAILALHSLGFAQIARKSNVSKGPRALGLLQLPPSGNGRLIPVAIVVDGKFYDASSYKANPVPMALDQGVVYEAFHTGVSQGLFTVTLPGKVGQTWIAQGTWLPAGAKPPQKNKKAEVPNIEEKDEPPKLHRGEKKQPSSAEKPAPPASAPTTQPAPAAAPPTTPPAATQPTSPPKEEEKAVEDPNRPVLRRGPQPPKPESTKVADEAPQTQKPGAKQASAALPLIPAISDAAGPDPRPYTFDLRPGEEASYKSKMLELAATEVRGRNKPEQNPATGHSGRHAIPPPKVNFDDVHLRIFDLSLSNEPVLVLSAKIHPAAFESEQASQPQEITLVAKTNLEGEVRKLFFSQTDPRHLDSAPQMELIDAVDADGDGRGELLFRQTTDAGSAYAIYRATADQLWPLYEGTP